MREKIVELAREYKGTAFQHQARLKGIAIDCVGLLMCVAWELDLEMDDCLAYAAQPDGTVLMQELQKRFIEIDKKDAKPGDILVFWISRHTRFAQHVAIQSEMFDTRYMIHTYAEIKKVTEHVIDERWDRRIVTAFKYPGVE